ncbi:MULTISPECIES: ABC transporter substrate-binding protein [unclassified Variovorax]|uniref:ABC transporter substrate-binding protein n=1 Tax=unclassified Variovorax TaxID=663243 RepID=UPI0008B1F757|nr:MULTISPECIES: ABC transporter substrate-binding protein [unclassified Variovorax]SEK16716.1 ABC-type branched-chain amino acid transport system, substrate-binding protein [Variovorax sp. OK202]SFE56249.1 ABC-type branched-chain amino acid transport system, substrate-binding protein [Variovorax sp. OK212]
MSSQRTHLPHLSHLSRRDVLGLGSALAGASLMGGAQNVFAQRGDTIKIGSARAMTGLVASSFAPLYVSVKIAVEEINAKGGILGRQVEIVEADDESSPAKEPAVMRKLIDAGAQALLGPVGSSHTIAAATTTTAAKVIHAGGGWAEELADGRKYPYHYQFTYNTGHQGEAIARLIVEKLKLKKVGILQENSGLGESGGAATVRSLKKRGLEPVGIEVYPPNATDLKVYLNKLRAAGADAIVLWNSPVQGMLLTAAGLQAMKWYPALLGGNSLFSNTVLENTDPEVLKNAYGTLIKTMTYSATEAPGARQVAYAKRVVTFPEAKFWEINAAISPFYDYLHLLKAVVESEKRFDTERIKKAFDATKDYDGMIGSISFTPDNHCALTGDQMVMATLLSGKDARSMGVFRERA